MLDAALEKAARVSALNERRLAPTADSCRIYTGNNDKTLRQLRDFAVNSRSKDYQSITMDCY